MPRKKKGILPGYPKEFVFEAREEVDAYLSGDRVTCLRCGHSYRLLETHLRGAHNMTGNEYREIYGLPYLRGLCAADFSERRVELGRALWEENKDRQAAALAKAKAVQAECGNPQRRKPVFWKKERTLYSPDDFREFMRRVLSGRSLMSVSGDEDMPHITHVYWYCKRDAKFAKEWAESRRIAYPQGQVNLSKTRPWDAEGVCRRTWERRRTVTAQKQPESSEAGVNKSGAKAA